MKHRYIQLEGGHVVSVESVFIECAYAGLLTGPVGPPSLFIDQFVEHLATVWPSTPPILVLAIETTQRSNRGTPVLPGYLAGIHFISGPRDGVEENAAPLAVVLGLDDPMTALSSPSLAEIDWARQAIGFSY